MIKRRIKYTILIAFLLMILYLIFFPGIWVLSISNRKNPAQRIYSDQAYNVGFCISYTHSVNKGRVHDYYICDKKTKELVMQMTHFVSYGAGMPELEETEGAVFELLENGYLMKNVNRRVPKLMMAVGVIANHTFAPEYYGAEKIGEPLCEMPLKDYFAPQTSLILECKRVNYIDFFKHRIK